MRKLSERLGTIGFNKFGSKMVVVKYNRSDDMWVQFEQGNLVHTEWKDFYIGNIKNVYDRSVSGVGFMGEGSYKSWINGKMAPQYDSWRSMLQRCYNEKIQKNAVSYKNCTVVEEWHNFQNYARWYDENFYQIANEKMQLDKDILIKGNKIYSPDTCVFVPQRINCMFTSCLASRGLQPIGVSFDKRYNTYRAACLNGNGRKINYLGSFASAEEAFQSYKAFKEKTVQQVAEEYKENIPNKLYNALLNFVVEIDD